MHLHPIDPLTGWRVYLTNSTMDECETAMNRAHFLAEVDEQRNAHAQWTLRTAMR